jgi:alpha-N-acetylglucosamine transferase
MVSAVATLLFSASYLPGALVLAHTLRQKDVFDDANGLKLVVLLACDLTSFEKNQLSKAFDEVIPIDLIHARFDSLELKLLERPELCPTFSKINLFKLTEFDQVLYLDSDTLPLKSITSLFQQFTDLTERDIVASPDSGWPDIFNSGVFLIKPSIDTYLALLEKIQNTSASPSFDGADQGLLNEFFHLDGRDGYSWKRLPFLYNVTPSGQYQYQPAFKYFEDSVKLVHYIGSNKPWFDVGDKDGLRNEWWNKYHEFFGSDDDIQKTIHGIDPIYYIPEVEEETKEKLEDNEDVNVLLNPESYQYFKTIDSSGQWDPKLGEPSKSGKPEAEFFPRSLSKDYSDKWDSEAFQAPEEIWKPEPLFPWEVEHREVVPERVFEGSGKKNGSWESLPLVKKIKDKQQEELKARERARQLAEQTEEDEDDLFNKEKYERLKEIENRYSGDIVDETIEQDLMDGDKEDDELVAALDNVHLPEA